MVGMLVMQLYRINTKVLCRYTGRDKSVKKKWAKAKNGERIEFANGWYYIRSRCIKFESSFFNLLQMRVIEFSYLSHEPLDPATGEPTTLTPEERKNLDMREDVENLGEGSKKSFGVKKQGLFGGSLIPIVLTVGIVACFYFIWQLTGKVDMIGAGQNVMEQMLGEIINKLPR